MEHKRKTYETRGVAWNVLAFTSDNWRAVVKKANTQLCSLKWVEFLDRFRKHDSAVRSHFFM